MGEKPENQAGQTPTQQQGVFKRIFHHPNFSVVSGIATIVSLILAIYFYEESVTEPNLTYYISNTRTPIVQPGKLNNFSVNYQGEQITGYLSSAEIQIWNAGKAPIMREDILKTVTLRTPHGEQIYSPTFVTTRDVIGI